MLPSNTQQKSRQRSKSRKDQYLQSDESMTVTSPKSKVKMSDRIGGNPMLDESLRTQEKKAAARGLTSSSRLGEYVNKMQQNQQPGSSNFMKFKDEEKRKSAVAADAAGGTTQDYVKKGFQRIQSRNKGKIQENCDSLATSEPAVRESLEFNDKDPAFSSAKQKEQQAVATTSWRNARSQRKKQLSIVSANNDTASDFESQESVNILPSRGRPQYGGGSSRLNEEDGMSQQQHETSEMEMSETEEHGELDFSGDTRDYDQKKFNKMQDAKERENAKTRTKASIESGPLEIMENSYDQLPQDKVTQTKGKHTAKAVFKDVASDDEGHFLEDEEYEDKKLDKAGRQQTKFGVDAKNQKLSGLKGLAAKAAVKSPLFRSMSMIMQSKGMQMGQSFLSTAEAAEKPDHDMRKIFLESYGVEMDFPGYYYYDSKFVPAHSDYITVLAWHIVPQGKNKQVQTTLYNRTYKDDPFEDLYTTKGKDMILKLLNPLKTRVFDIIEEIQLIGIQKAFIEFSKPGNLFGIYDQKKKQLYVYTSKDIKQCFRDIKDGAALYTFKINDENFDAAERIIFDLREKWVAVVSKAQIIFFNLKDENERKHVDKYVIDENYEYILDILIDSKLCKNQRGRPFNCTIACKQDVGRKMIEIFDIHDDLKDMDNVRCILYQQVGKKLMCKISDDCNQVVFSNGVEHYILKGKSQDFFPQIGDKTIRHCINHNNEFYFVNSQEYDRDCDIQNSANIKFNASIVRSLEPGQIKVFDTEIQHGIPGSKKGHMRIIMNQGDYLFLDTINIDDCMDDKQRGNAHINTCIDKMYMAYGFNWPYFSYATKFNYVFILNAFNANFIQRYQLPKHIVCCTQTFLSDTHDFYCMCETEYGFELYNIDLDSPEPYLEGPLLQYSNENVKNLALSGFHVRSSSRKEKVNLNKALICLMMHGNILYGWCESDGNKVTPVNTFSTEADPAAMCSNFYYLSDDEAFYMTNREMKSGKRRVIHSQIKLVQAQFGTYKVSDIYEDKDARAEILNFGVDNTNKRLLILTGIKNRKGKRDKFITLYSFNREKIIFSMQIKNVEIIGRLKSNLYNFVGGHIYFNNNVIKIRYDLLEHASAESLPENQVFDHYTDVLSLQTNDFVQTGTPLQTCLYNRLAYIIQNQVNLKSRKVLIMPYLHERRIYLNRRHAANQFYTLCKHQSGLTLILCLCIPDNKMYIYTETGILVDRVSYADLAEKYGKPVEISENGLILIFQKSAEHTDIHLIQVHIDKLEWVATIDVKKRMESYLANMEIASGSHIQMTDKLREELTTFYEKPLKKLEKMKNIEMQICLNDDAEILVRLKPKKQESWEKSELAKKMMLRFLKNNPEFQEQQVASNYEECSLFYFFPNPNIEECRARCQSCFGCSKLGQAIENQRDPDDDTPETPNEEFIYFDSDADQITKLKGISMNQDYVFYWNSGTVWKMSLANQELTKIGLYVDEAQLETFVTQVRTGSDKTKVAIRVTQTKTMDCIIIWDLVNDLEIESFDVQSDAMFFQDRWGNQYLAENDYIINCSQTCKLKSYKMQVKDFESPQFEFGNGYRVDDEMHNFILMRNYINLSFSYMTFVIKKNFDQGGYISKDYLFDSEGYDYVLGRNTVFTEGTLVTQDYDKLNFILKCYHLEDPVLLEQLYYKNNLGKTPLHIAVKANNTRMVNLVLQFLSRLKNSGITVIKDIFSDLIDYQDFATYLNSSPFQTLQMVNKQTICLKGQEDDDIVIVRPTNCSYVDEKYFELIMGENISNPRFQTYSVRIKCVRADWILQDSVDEKEAIGLNFMNNMLKKKNREVFMTPYMQIIIQFLYKQYSQRIMIALLPPYMLHLLFVNLQLFSNEAMRDKRSELDQARLGTNVALTELRHFEYDRLKSISNICVCCCGVFNVLNMLVFVMQSKSLGLNAFFRLWSQVDSMIIILNSITLINLIYKFGTSNIRMVECVLILMMWLKSLYYMRLVNEISPLVESIFVIMNDMQYFLIIFIIGLIAFSEAFFVIGKNQKMLANEALQRMGDNIDPSVNTNTDVSYSTFMGALQHGYMSALGELDVDDYSNNAMTPVLSILFVLLSFFMCIHMLNMLIAIMGQSFDTNAEVADSNRKISQLEFVVNNWWIHPIKNKARIVYFVAAFTMQDEGNGDSKLDQLQTQVQEIKEMLKNQLKEIHCMQYEISQFATTVNK